jgi:uncharacterized protein YjbI with pentapeptide repeats
MAAFSWHWEDEGTDVEEAGGEKQDPGGDIEDAHAELWDKMSKALSPQEKAHTALVRLLVDTAERVEHNKKAARKAENYTEAERLKQLHREIEATATVAGGERHLEDVGVLIQEASGLLLRWRTEQDTRAKRDAYAEAAAAKDKGDGLHALIDQARKLIAPGRKGQPLPQDIPLSHLLSIKLNGGNGVRSVIQLLDSAGVGLSSVNLQGVDISGLDISGLDLSGVTFRNTDLRGAKLKGVNLSRANLGGAQLQGADLSGSDLTGADLTGADLQGANLMNAKLQGANLMNAKLQGANLVNANFVNATFLNARFMNAKLQGADLGGFRLVRGDCQYIMHPSFRVLRGVAVNKEGHLFVSCQERNTWVIQVFSGEGPNGTHIKTLCTGQLLNGCAGLNGCAAVAIAGDASIYVADCFVKAVKVFDQEGNHVRDIGSGRLLDPWGVAVDAQEHVYVADSSNHVVSIFTKEGQFVRDLGVRGSEETAPGQLYKPTGVAVDGDGSVFVSNNIANTVSVFDQHGTFVRSIGQGHLSLPYGVAVCPSGLVYVASYGSTQVVVLDKTGTYIKSIPSSGPVHVCVDDLGQVCVAEYNQERILIVRDTA